MEANNYDYINESLRGLIEKKDDKMKEIVVDTFAHYLKSLRNKYKFTQIEMAEFCGMKFELYRTYESKASEKIYNAFKMISDWASLENFEPGEFCYYLSKTSSSLSQSALSHNKKQILSMIDAMNPDDRELLVEKFSHKDKQVHFQKLMKYCMICDFDEHDLDVMLYQKTYEKFKNGECKRSTLNAKVYDVFIKPMEDGKKNAANKTQTLEIAQPNDLI